MTMIISLLKLSDYDLTYTQANIHMQLSHIAIHVALISVGRNR